MLAFFEDALLELGYEEVMAYTAGQGFLTLTKAAAFIRKVSAVPQIPKSVTRTGGRRTTPTTPSGSCWRLTIQTPLKRT